MSLSVSFPAEIESTLRQHAVAIGKDVETFVRELVVEEVAEATGSPVRKRSHAEFKAKIDTMIQSHGIRNGKFDDSRESIYAGQGE